MIVEVHVGGGFAWEAVLQVIATFGAAAFGAAIGGLQARRQATNEFARTIERERAERLERAIEGLDLLRAEIERNSSIADDRLARLEGIPEPLPLEHDRTVWRSIEVRAALARYALSDPSAEQVARFYSYLDQAEGHLARESQLNALRLAETGLPRNRAYPAQLESYSKLTVEALKNSIAAREAAVVLLDGALSTARNARSQERAT